MVEPRRIAEVLGGRQVLRRRVASIIELSDAVAQGLPKSALRNAVRRISEDAGEQRRMMYRIVPEATFKRRRDRLSSVESERTERLARVIATAEYVWEDRDSARRFLMTPHPMLAGKAPLNAAMTELGARQVEDLLANILHGLPS
jgi:putative toxin-antitoxin system antitoxin component (TIGR02293 family)